MKSQCFAAHLFLCCVPFTLLAQSGSIDLSYGGDGWAQWDELIGSRSVRSMVVLPDESTVMLTDRQEPHDVALIHFDLQGEVDTTFGNGGIARINDPMGDWNDYRRQLVRQPDGKLIIGGSSSAGNDAFARMRLLPDGSLDSTFGTSGISRFNLSPLDDQGNGLLVLSSGQILVYGYTELDGPDACVARFDPDGSLDYTFNGTGYLSFNVPGAFTAMINDAVELPDGRVIVCGERSSGANIEAFAARILTNGQMDPAFPPQVYMIGDGTDLEPHAIALQSDGKAVIAARMSYADNDIAAIRILENGGLDSSFATNGFFKTGQDLSFATGEQVHIRPNGSIVLTGDQRFTGESYRHISAVKLTPNGILDQNFANGGIGTYVLSSSNNELGVASAYQVDGKLIIAGNANYRWSAVRIQDDLSTWIEPAASVTPTPQFIYDANANSWWCRCPSEDKVVDVVVLDVMGRIIQQAASASVANRVTIPTLGLTTGTYLVRVTDQQQSFAGRILVSN